MDLAEPGGFLRPFLDLGEPLAALLRDVASSRPSSAYLDRLLTAFGDTRPTSETAHRRLAPEPLRATIDLLTDREVQVLELVRGHLTYKEVASALSISPLTVKRHVSNIFDKLGVASRRQAVYQATALGLLSSGSR